jgi:hypothetical protein
VKVPHKGKMVRGKIVRHDNGGSGKAQQHGGGYVVDVGEHGSITVPSHKVVREAAEQIDEVSLDMATRVYAEREKRQRKINRERGSGSPEASDNSAKAFKTYKYVKKHYGQKGLDKAYKAAVNVKEAAEQIDELSKKTKDAYVAKRGSQLSSMLSGHTRGKQLTGKQQANAVKGIKRAMGVKEEAEQIDEKKKMKTWSPRLDRLVKNRDVVRSKKPKWMKDKTVKEELIGGQKKLDVNKNKRLDSQDFAMLRSKKKPVKEYLDMASGMALQAPAPGDAVADKSGKGKRFHKKAVKMAEAAMAKARKPKQKTAQKSDRSGAANVIGRQSAIKHTLAKHDMRW